MGNNTVNIKLPPWPKESEQWDWRKSEEWLREQIEQALDIHAPEWRERGLVMTDFQLEGAKLWKYKGEQEDLYQRIKDQIIAVIPWSREQ